MARKQKKWPDVECSECGAKPGEPCRSRSGNEKSGPHYSRIGKSKRNKTKPNDKPKPTSETSSSKSERAFKAKTSALRYAERMGSEPIGKMFIDTWYGNRLCFLAVEHPRKPTLFYEDDPTTAQVILNKPGRLVPKGNDESATN